MKILFVGEGRHDIGDPDPQGFTPRPAVGTIPTLSRRVCPSIDATSIALAWTEIVRFNPTAKKSGFEAKVTAAAILSHLKFDCAGTVCVVDRDGKPERLPALQRGCENGRKRVPIQHPIVCGVAVESVEAWTLGVPQAIADVLGEDVTKVKARYPRGPKVEALKESNGQEEHRPKALLQRIAQLKLRNDSTVFRQDVAEHTDIADLELTCNQGFAPFARDLRQAFGSK